MSTSHFNLVHTIAVLQRKWKLLAGIVLLAMITAAITVYLVPKQYRSSATLVAANPVLADKARMFNNNIQSLYSYFGSGDDLDRLYGIAQTDTSFKLLVDSFNLIDYYRLKNDSLPLLRRKAVLKLRDDLRFQKNEQGQLQVIAWTKIPGLSAELVNKMVAIIQHTEMQIWQNNYRQSLTKLDTAIHSMELEYAQLYGSIDTMPRAKLSIISSRMQNLIEQLKQYRQTYGEFKLAGETNTPALYILENAVPAAKADRPDKVAIILAAGAVGFVFGCLLLLIGYRSKQA